jgi:hypothetical protein
MFLSTLTQPTLAMPKYPHNSALSVAVSHIEPNLENQLASFATSLFSAG